MRRAPCEARAETGQTGTKRRPAAVCSGSSCAKGKPQAQQGREPCRSGVHSGLTSAGEAAGAAQEQTERSAGAVKRSAQLRTNEQAELPGNGQGSLTTAVHSRDDASHLLGCPQVEPQMLKAFHGQVRRVIAYKPTTPGGLPGRCAFEKVEWPYGSLFLTEPALNQFRKSTNKYSYSKCSTDKRRRVSDALTDTCRVNWSRQMVLVVTSNHPFQKYQLKGYSWNAATSTYTAEVCLEEKKKLAAPSGLDSYSAWILEINVEEGSQRSARGGDVELLLRGAPGPTGEMLLRGDRLPLRSQDHREAYQPSNT